MDFNPDDEDILLTGNAGRWVSQSYDWMQRQASVAAGGFDAGVWRNMAAMGWLAALLDEEIGGLGLSLGRFVLLMTELGKGLVVEPLVTNAVVCAHVLNCGAGKATALAQSMASGEAVLALAARERGDWGESAVSARRVDGGWRLEGRLAMVPDAAAASHYLVAAEADDGPAVFVVARDAPGLRVAAFGLVDGRSAADLGFEGVTLAEPARLLSGSAAQLAVEQAVDRGIAARLGELVGGMEACLEASAAHLKERRQFGQPLASFQALQHLGADMFVDCYQARSMLYYLLSRLDTETEAQAISEAKLLIGEMAGKVTANAMQAHGAIAFTEEFRIGHFYKRVLATQKLAGDEDFHHARLARSKAGLPCST